MHLIFWAVAIAIGYAVLHSVISGAVRKGVSEALRDHQLWLEGDRDEDLV